MTNFVRAFTLFSVVFVTFFAFAQAEPAPLCDPKDPNCKIIAGGGTSSTTTTKLMLTSTNLVLERSAQFPGVTDSIIGTSYRPLQLQPVARVENGQELSFIDQKRTFAMLDRKQAKQV